jgi:hypothetical protein
MGSGGDAMEKALLVWDAARWVANPVVQKFTGMRWSVMEGTAGFLGRDPHEGVKESEAKAVLEVLHAAGKAVGERFDATMPPTFPLAAAAEWATALRGAA